MDLRLLSLGERIAAASGALLLVLMFLPWTEDPDLNAWQRYTIADVLFATLALAAITLPLCKAAAVELPLRALNGTLLTRIGTVVTAVTTVAFLEGPTVGEFLAALASAGILYGGVTTPEAASRSHRRDRPLNNHENVGDPAEGGRELAEAGPAVGNRNALGGPVGSRQAEAARLAERPRHAGPAE